MFTVVAALFPNIPSLELDGVKLNGDGLAVLDGAPNPPNEEVNGFEGALVEVFSADVLRAELVIALSFIADGKLNGVGAADEDGLVENALKGFMAVALFGSTAPDEPLKDSEANGLDFSLAGAVAPSSCNFLVLGSNEENANCLVFADASPNDRDANGFGSAFKFVHSSFSSLPPFDKLNRFDTAVVDSIDGFSDSDANGLVDFGSSLFLLLFLLLLFFDRLIMVLEVDGGAVLFASPPPLMIIFDNVLPDSACCCLSLSSLSTCIRLRCVSHFERALWICCREHRYCSGGAGDAIVAVGCELSEEIDGFS
jgi:hypothetical protein